MCHSCSAIGLTVQHENVKGVAATPPFVVKKMCLYVCDIYRKRTLEDFR